MADYENLRAVDTRWTPLTNEVRDIIETLQHEAGSWRTVAAATGIRTRYIRRLRQRVPNKATMPLKAVSLYVLDKLLSLSDKAYIIDELPWYTVEEMIEMGHWDLPLPNGLHRHRDKGQGASDEEAA